MSKLCSIFFVVVCVLCFNLFVFDLPLNLKESSLIDL